MRIFLIAAILAITPISSFAQTVTYKVFLDHLESKEVKVVVELNGFQPSETASYQMPAWAPGAYSVTNYGRFLKDFKVMDEKGKEIPSTKANENRWQMQNARNVKYFTYTVTNSFLDSTSLYFALCHIDTNFFFANATALFGYVNDRKDVQDTVVYYTSSIFHNGHPHYSSMNPDSNDVRLFSPLDPCKAPHSDLRSNFLNADAFIARDYDELADAPVMAGKKIQLRQFNQNGAKYVIALSSDQAFAMDSLERATKAVIKSQTDFFGDTPFKQYIFLINAPSYFHLPSQGMGALEHANSSAYLMMNMPWDGFKQFGLPVISHEFFHLWNVKRIHSSKLGPFDYTQAVKTTSLWLSEGVTDYYAQTLLTRSGILPPSFFEAKISEWLGATKNSKVASSETLEQLSIDESNFSMEKAISFYTKAPLVALMLDLEIRTQTANKRSLDDVMHSLYAKAKANKHFTDEELIGQVEQISGAQLQDFYKRYIAGHDTLPIASYLIKMGLAKDVVKSVGVGVSFHHRLSSDEDHAIIDSLFPNSELATSGVVIGDTIISLNGQTANRETVSQFSRSNDAPQVVKLVIGSKKKRFNTNVVLTKPLYYNDEKKSIAPVANPTALQIAIRKGIYGG